MLYRTILMGLLGLLVTVGAQADVLGWRVGANGWLQNYEGDIQKGASSADIESDLGFDDDSGFSFYASLEHPVPLIPNFMLQHSKIDSDSRSQANGAVRSRLDLTHTDATFYYELLDNWINFDLGLTVRRFDQGISVTDQDTGITSDIDFDFYSPLAYGELRFDLPFTGWSVGVTGNGGNYDDKKVVDIKANLAYQFGFGLGVEGGYRHFDFDYEDGNEEADITVDGIYGGIFWDF